MRGQRVAQSVRFGKVSRRARSGALIDQLLRAFGQSVGAIENAQNRVEVAQRGDAAPRIGRRQRSRRDAAVQVTHEVEDCGQPAD